MADAPDGPVTNVQVAVRCRPFSTKEKNNGEVSCVRITDSHITLTNPSNSADEHNFAFDVLIDENWAQESVWTKIGTPMLEKAFAGYNGERR